MTRKVWVVFYHDSGLPDRAMTIGKRGPVIGQVEAQLSPYERGLLVGVLNASKTAWID